MAASPESSSERINQDNWREFAACLNLDPDLFFPIGTAGPALEQIERAKDVCRTCMVQTICLEYALVTNQEHGVWGGTSEEERRTIRRQRRQTRSA